MKTKFIASDKNTNDRQYFWAKKGDRFVGCYWLTESGNWIVQVWNSDTETQAIATRREAIATLTKLAAKM